MSKRKNTCDDGGLAMLVLGLMFAPVIGLFMCFSDNQDTRTTGQGLLFISAVVYILGFIGQMS